MRIGKLEINPWIGQKISTYRIGSIETHCGCKMFDIGPISFTWLSGNDCYDFVKSGQKYEPDLEENESPKCEPIEAYMCAVDFHYELGEALGGSTLYPDVEDLKENMKCWKGCGIVKVSVTLVSTIEPSKI